MYDVPLIVYTLTALGVTVPLGSHYSNITLRLLSGSHETFSPPSPLAGSTQELRVGVKNVCLNPTCPRMRPSKR